MPPNENVCENADEKREQGKNKQEASGNGEIFTAGARGKIKYGKGEIVTGDVVEFCSGAITSVYPRKNKFERPNIANVDVLCALIAAQPMPDLAVVDKLMLAAAFSGAEYALVVNKSDLGDEVYKKALSQFTEATPKVFCVSAKTGDGIGELKEFLRGKEVAFAGQSAVGKTTLINALFGTEYKTGALSEKLGRGRHTTTCSRLIQTGDIAVFDTPGFSEFYAVMSPEDAAANFPPYENYLGKCKFCNCGHVGEPDCAVKNAVKAGELGKERYERYKVIYREIEKEYKNRYERKRI